MEFYSLIGNSLVKNTVPGGLSREEYNKMTLEKYDQMADCFNEGDWDGVLENSWITDKVSEAVGLVAFAYAKKGNYKDAFLKLGFLWDQPSSDDNKYYLCRREAMELAKQVWEKENGRKMTEADLKQVHISYIEKSCIAYFVSHYDEPYWGKDLHEWERLTGKKLKDKKEQIRIAGKTFQVDYKR